jgi:predicted nucleic acid-binding protein
MIWVVDTSALMRLFVPDGPVPDALERALGSAERGEDVLCAPDLILAEAGQVLHKKRTAGLLTDDEVETMMGSILSLPLRITPHREIVSSACHLAPRESLTVCDALFLALADKLGGRLITSDSVLRKAADRLGY